MKNILFLLAVVLLVGCKTKERVVTVTQTRTDTCYITKHQRDSIYLHDSTFVKEFIQGDTVRIVTEKWHTAYRDRLKTDTVYKSSVDSVPVPYPVVKEVPAELSWWQHTQMYAGDVVIFAVIILLFWKYLLPLARKLIFKI